MLTRPYVHVAGYLELAGYCDQWDTLPLLFLLVENTQSLSSRRFTAVAPQFGPPNLHAAQYNAVQPNKRELATS
jgi:hypothetical protein